MAKHNRLPKYNELLNPLLQALHDQIAVNSGPDRFSLFTFKQESTADLTPFHLWNRGQRRITVQSLWLDRGCVKP